MKTTSDVVATCDIPAGEFTSNITSTSAKTNWNPIATANKYKVRYRVTGTNGWTKTSSANNFRKLQSLLPSMQYDWQVESICSDLGLGNSGWSTTQNFTTDPLRVGLEDEVSFEIFPNPFSSSTTISFSLPQAAHTTIELFDLAGRKIKTLLDENVAAGNHEVQLNREQLGAGIYFLSATINGSTSTSKLIIE